MKRDTTQIKQEKESLMRFEGKNVLVTGAASGIGRATAIRFAAEGADVTIGDVNEAGLQETAALMARSRGVVVIGPA